MSVYPPHHDDETLEQRPTGRTTPPPDILRRGQRRFSHPTPPDDSLAPTLPTRPDTEPLPPIAAAPTIPVTAVPVEHVPPPAAPPVYPAVPPARPTQRGWWLAIGLLGIGLVVVAILLGAVAVRVISNAQAGFRLSPAMALIAVETPTPSLPTFPPPPTPTLDLVIRAWEGTERFTILLLGLDKRPFDRGTAFRTDSMIIVSIDPKTRSIGMLSVPRDLYVEIPRTAVIPSSYGIQRINTAYFIGETVQPGYGPQLAMQTVQYNLGIRINDYIVYDFQAVIGAIDAIGGLTINVEREIIDYEYPDMNSYGYDPLYIAAGVQHMNGDLALKYARSRHGTSDFDRAKRQQKVILAIRDKILSLNMLPELIIRAPGLWSQLSRHMQSGLTLEQWLRLAVYAKDISPTAIRTGVIEGPYVQPIFYNGASVLSPNRAAIGQLLVEVFGPDYNQ